MPDETTILVVDDVPANVRVLRDRLEKQGYEVTEAGSGAAALQKVQERAPDLVLLDILMPEVDGYQVLERLKGDENLRHIPVIVISAVDQISSIVRCLELGAEDYLSKPFEPLLLKARIGACLDRKRAEAELRRANERLEQRVEERTLELKDALEEVRNLKNRLEAENVYLQQELGQVHGFQQAVSRSAAFRGVLDAVRRVARTEATVLILGETGTGKELVARSLHALSARRDRPLVKVNCAALPAPLIESELFGHERGAFTGADTRRAGRFELADGGTIFLDEVAELPLDLQPKLLRVLQERAFERVGSATTITVDVRVIAATNRDLRAAMGKGTFREDLFYRLNVFPITCPPLRERLEDIPPLVEHFLGKHAAGIGRRIEGIAEGVLEALAAYDWPGTVRELENALQRGIIMSRGDLLEPGDWLPRKAPTQSTGPSSSAMTLEEKDREHIVQVLALTGWRVRGSGGAAQLLGLKPTTLEARMKKLGIRRDGDRRA